MVPEYDGNLLFLNTFISLCTTAFSMATDNQEVLILVAEYQITSRKSFRDPRDSSAFMQDLQRLRQLNNESLLTFAARIQTHLAKTVSSVNKQTLTTKEKQAQIYGTK